MIRPLRGALQGPQLSIHPEMRQPANISQAGGNYDCEVLATANILYMFGDEPAVNVDRVGAELGWSPGKPLPPGSMHRYLLDNGYAVHDVGAPGAFDVRRFYDEGIRYWRMYMDNLPANERRELTDAEIDARRDDMETQLAYLEHPNYTTEVREATPDVVAIDLLLGGCAVDLTLRADESRADEPVAHAALAWGFRARPNLAAFLVYDPNPSYSRAVCVVSADEVAQSSRSMLSAPVTGIKKVGGTPNVVREALVAEGALTTSPIHNTADRRQLCQVIDRLRSVVRARDAASSIALRLDDREYRPMDIDTALYAVSGSAKADFEEVAAQLIACYDQLYDDVITRD